MTLSGHISETTELISIKFSVLNVMYPGVHTGNCIEIGQGFGFIFCLRAQHVYLVKYGIEMNGDVYVQHTQYKLQVTWVELSHKLPYHLS